MSLKRIVTSLPGVFVFEPDVFTDQRGFFMETYHQQKYVGSGLAVTFVQENHSHSCKGTLRGLHYQLHHPQGKLVFVVTGEIFDAAIDIRRGSPTFAQWVGINLSAENKRQVYVPPGFAHGFCVLSKHADVMYKCTDLYVPGDDYGILWSDQDIAIDWPVTEPILSDKDSKNPPLAEIPPDRLPLYQG